MDVEIVYRPSYSLALVRLAPHEEIRVEAGSMVSMSDGVSLQTQATGGLLKSLTRSIAGGESFFQNVFRAPAGGGEITLAPALPGDLVVLELENQSMLIQSGSFVAAETSLRIDTTWGGARAFFGSEGLIMLRVSGSGKAIISAYGAIHRRDLSPGERYTVDSGHLVAFPDNIGFKVRPVGSIKSTFLSKEGLVVDLTGPGSVFIQTRSIDAFLSWLLPKLPSRRG
ncbi:MAG: TIGR00266 family protein [Ardenticatenia bacterium]|jgi:uncharacterized protein (TIGR00266 family)|nr:MAG: TIGR00266 family protein [Ardenticatenia bacterium]